jgi:GABA permease
VQDSSSEAGTAIAIAGPAIIASYALAGLTLLWVRDFAAEIQRRVPNASLLSDFVDAGLGTVTGSVARYIYGCFWLLVAAIGALAGANILAPLRGHAAFPISIALVAATAGLGKPLRALLARFELWLALAKLTAILGFVVLMACHLVRAEVPTPTAPSISPVMTSFQCGAEILSGIVIALFSLAGAEASFTLSRALISLRVLAIYLVPIALILTVMRFSAILPGFSPFTLALETLDHTWAARCLDLLILLGVVKVLNAALAISSRLLGRNAAQLHAPRRFWTAASAAAVLCVAAHWPANEYAFLVEAAGVVLTVIYILLVFAAGRLSSAPSPLRAGPQRWYPYMLGMFLALALLSMAWVHGLAAPLTVGLSAVLFMLLLNGVILMHRRRALD